MYHYKVEYTFSTGIPGKKRRVRDYDLYRAENCQKAVDLCRNEYGHLEGLRIEGVWKETNSWIRTDAWD